MTKFLAAAVLALGLSFGGVANAAQPSFDNVSVTAQSHSFTSSDPVGFNVSAEKSLNSNVFVVGSMSRVYWDSDVQGTQFTAGLGLKKNLFSPDLVVYGDVYVLHVGELGLKDYHSYGYGAEAGVRDQLGAVQLRGAVATERSVETAGWTTYAKLGAQVSLTKHFALIGDLKYHDASNRVYGLGLAYNF